MCFIHFIACSTHLSIRHYSAVVSSLGKIHKPIGLTLIVTVSGCSQLDIGCLGKRGFELIGLALPDGYHLAVLLFSVAPIVYIVSTSCAHCCFVHIPILIHRHQLIGVTVRPHTALPKSKRGTNTH